MKSAQYHPCEVGENNYLHTGKAGQAQWSAQDGTQARSKWTKACDSQGRLTPVWPSTYQSSQLRIFLSFANTPGQKKAWKIGW